MEKQVDAVIDQEVLVDEALSRITQNGSLMKVDFESENLREALKHASDMVTELKNPALSPKSYYSICILLLYRAIVVMTMFSSLKELEEFFLEQRAKKGRRMSDLYEAVQQAPDILPRLYLMMTAGSAFIGSKEVAAKEILTDLIEMAKGIQHPVRGLFLRYFMLKKLKERFPDKGSQYEG